MIPILVNVKLENVQQFSTNGDITFSGICAVAFSGNSKLYDFFLRQDVSDGNKFIMITVYENSQELFAFDAMQKINYSFLKEEFKTLSLLFRRPLLMMLRKILNQYKHNQTCVAYAKGTVERIALHDMMVLFQSQRGPIIFETRPGVVYAIC